MTARSLLAALLLVASGAAVACTPTNLDVENACDGSFDQIRAESPKAFSALGDVVVVSRSEVYAVGGTTKPSRRGVESTDPLVERLAGGRLEALSGPTLSTRAYFQAAAVEPDGALLATGDTDDTVYRIAGGDWTVRSIEVAPEIEGPHILTGFDLAGEAAWAVGRAGPPGAMRPLLAHRSGNEPMRTTATGLPAEGSLEDVDAVSPLDVWAVGGSRGAVTLHGGDASLAAVPNPADVDPTAVLRGVHAVGPADVWAVGSIGPLQRQDPLVLHWDGVAWSETEVPAFPGTSTRLEDVAAVGADDVWAVGTSTRRGLFISPVILHWDGSTWSIAQSANGGASTSLTAVAALDDGTVWAVGFSQPETGSLTVRAFAERRCT